MDLLYSLGQQVSEMLVHCQIFFKVNSLGTQLCCKLSGRLIKGISEIQEKNCFSSYYSVSNPD